MAEEEKKKLVKRPTAQKRILQDERKCRKNRAFTAKLKTIKTNFEKADIGQKKSLLKVVHSLLDKAQKRGLYKKNKTARLKANLTKKCSA